MEIRFDPHASIGSVEEIDDALWDERVGDDALVLRDEEGGVLAVMGDERDDRLGYYSC